MTREEMIEQLENTILLIKQNGKDWVDERDIPILEEAMKAIKTETCEDCIRFPKGTLKKRGKDYVVYNVEWLKKHWQTELEVMGIECEDAISGNCRAKLEESEPNLEEAIKSMKAEPCKDCVSRSDLLKTINKYDDFGYFGPELTPLVSEDGIKLVPYIHYIRYDDAVKCINSASSVTPQQAPCEEREKGECPFYAG